MDAPSDNNVISLASRRKSAAPAAPATAPLPPCALPPVDMELSLSDLGLARFGDGVFVTGPGCLLAAENLRLAPAFTPSDARLVARTMLRAADVAECAECAPRLASADEGDVFSADAVGLCARCAS